MSWDIGVNQRRGTDIGAVQSALLLEDCLIGAWELNEASGDAIDSFASNDLADTNTVGSGTGVVYSTARDFEESNDEYFTIADNADLSMGNFGFTIEAWFKYESNSNYRVIVGKGDGSAGGAEYQLFLNQDLGQRIQFLVGINGADPVNSVVADTAGNLSSGTWYQAIVWHDAVNNVLGVAINAGTADTVAHTAGVYNGTNAFRIGCDTDTSRSWDGLIGPVRLWNRVLSASDRTRLYNRGIGRPVATFAQSPWVNTVTVKSSGGNYTTLSAAEAGEQRDLVSLDQQLTIECYASAAPDTTQVVITGWTTDAARYILITCPVGERHEGIWNTGKYYIASTTSSNGGVIIARAAFTRIEYLQVQNTTSSPGQFNDCIYGDVGELYIDGCLARDGYSCFSLGVANSRIRNSVGYGSAHGCCFISGTAGGYSVAYNCTFIGVYGLTSTASVSYPRASNVYVHGSTRGFANLNGSANSPITKTNCMSSDTTATENGGGGGATNCTNSVAHSTANFSNVTGGSEDYRLASGSALIAAGVDLSGTFTNDIDGTTRTVPFDVGADEFASSGQTASPDVGTVALAGVAPAASGTGIGTATPGAGTVALAGASPTSSGTGTGTATPGFGVVALAGASPTASGTGTGTATLGAGTVALSGTSPVASGTGTGTTTPGAGTVAVSGADANATGNAVVASAGIGTVALSGISPSASGSGTGTATPGVGTVAVSGVSPAGTATGQVSCTPGVATVLVSGTDPTATPGGSTASPGFALVALLGVAPSASGFGTGTAVPGFAVVAVLGVNPISSGGFIPTPPISSADLDFDFVREGELDFDHVRLAEIDF